MIVTVVTVRDPGDLEAGIERWERRYRFEDSDRAWHTYVRAIQAGFEATSEKVETRTMERTG